MHQKRKIHLALPLHPDIRAEINNSLQMAVSLGLGDYALTNDICEAEVVITDSATLNQDISNLSDTTRYIQLIDCGSGNPYATNDILTVANASSFLANSAANWAIHQWKDIIQHSQNGSERVAGIVGFGILGYQISKQLNKLDAKTWVNDIRTPRSLSLQEVGARRSSLDMLLATSDAVFLSLHPGPTSTPLLSHRELRLLTTKATIINLSDETVVDKTAIENINANPTFDQHIDYHEIPTDISDTVLTKHPDKLTRYILDNLGKYAISREPRSIVETVTHPPIGDPTFWSSRMNPRQAPV